MAVRIEGLVSKKVIRAWLDDWDSLQGDGPPKYQACFNSDSKPYDGVSNKQLNKIMLEAALNDLPPVLYVCAKYRWVEQLPLSETLERTGIAKSTYYRRCDKAVEFIYYHVNGITAGIKDLLEKIREV